MARLLMALIMAMLLQCADWTIDRSLPFGPIVVINFDDGDPSIYNFAFPLMRRINPAWSATNLLPVSYVNAPGCLTLDHLQEMEKAGWETGGHGITHANLSAIPLDSAEAQIKGSHDFLVRAGLGHETFAYPFGNYCPAVESVAVRYFVNLRSTHDFDYLSGVDRRNLGYYAVRNGHTAADVIARVEEARSIGSPLVIIAFHAVLPDSAPPIRTYWCRESAFRGFMEYLAQQNLPVMSIQNALKTQGLL